MLLAKPNHRLSSRRVHWLVLGVLVILAALSTTFGIRDAVHRSQDFQWSGARLLLAHIDPWAEYLRGDPQHRFNQTQVPNYLPILYLLIAPLGSLSLLSAKIFWVCCNIGFAVASAILAARFYGLRSGMILAAVCLMLIATPTRTTFGNGQQGLLVLLLWCLSLLRPRLSGLSAAIGGISYFKFNFAPPTFLYLLFRGGIRAVVFSAIPSIIATVLLWLWLTAGHGISALAHLVIEPFAVSRTGYFPSGGSPNLMDVLEALLVPLHISQTAVNAVTLTSALIAFIAILYMAMRRPGKTSIQLQIALLGTMSFCLFKHHPYDSVVLVFPLFHALRLWKDKHAQAILLIIGYLWYLQRLVDAAHVYPPHLFVYQFVLLMVVLLMTWRLRSVEAQVEPGWNDIRDA